MVMFYPLLLNIYLINSMPLTDFIALV